MLRRSGLGPSPTIGSMSAPTIPGPRTVVAPAQPTHGRSVRPNAEQLAAWRTFLRAHASVTRRLEADLLEEHQLPLASYDVLVQLVEAPDRRLRMTELADRVLLSRSGLTRLVDRLEREGLVRREACETDARGLFAVLTDAGFARLKRAAPTHLRGIEDYVVSRLDDAELGVLGALLGRLLPDDEDEGTCGEALSD
jgi:DNA-binding MarR family transcriptional regulator